jgi:hypothetical protein
MVVVQTGLANDWTTSVRVVGVVEAKMKGVMAPILWTTVDAVIVVAVVVVEVRAAGSKD